MQMGNFRKGTPSAGLDIITGTIPLDLYIKEEIMNARIRQDNNTIHTWDGIPTRGKAQIGHIAYAERLLSLAGNAPENLDRIKKTPLRKSTHSQNPAY